jgi:hypothetical protein
MPRSPLDWLHSVRLVLLERKIQALHRMIDRYEREHAGLLDSLREDLRAAYAKQTRLRRGS